MKKITQLLVLVASLLLVVSTSWAQATLTETTLSAAITSTSSQTFAVANATGFSAGRLAFVDREAFRISSVSGTTITVSRTGRTSTHASGATVYVGPAEYFTTRDRAGSCTSTLELVLPVINIDTGIIYQCTSSLWTIIGGPVNAGLTLSAPTLSAPVITSSTGRARYCTVPVGSVAYGSVGTDTTPSATTTYYSEVYVPRSVTFTGIAVLNGSVGATDKLIVALHPSATGAALVTSNLAGVTAATANVFQDVPFTAPYAAAGPARYFIALQVNGTTTRFRTIATLTFVDVLTTSNASTVFGTVPSLTVPTTFTAGVGPVACLY